jgi:hypothetical protein
VNDLNPGPANVRVLANGKALFSVTCDGYGFGEEVREFDLVSRTDRVRSDAGGGSDSIKITRSSDRQRLLLLDANLCCSWPATIYSAATARSARSAAR